MAKKKKIENASIHCPHCGFIHTAPITAGVYVTCSECGKDFYTEGVEVADKDSQRIYDYFRGQRKREIEAGKDEH